MPSEPTAEPLAVFLAAVTQFQHARRVLFDTLVENPAVFLQYTQTLAGKFADLEGGDLLQELHLYAEQQVASNIKTRSKERIAH